MNIHQNFEIRNDTLRLIRAFRALEEDTNGYRCRKDNLAALKGALSLVEAHLRNERVGDAFFGGRNMKEFSVVELFRAASKNLSTDSQMVTVSSEDIDVLSSIHLRLIDEGILTPQGSTGNALDLAMVVANDILERSPVYLRQSNGSATRFVCLD